MKSSDTLLKVAVGGAVVAALWCVTPVPVISFGVVGLSAFVAYLDYILIPALVVFIALIVYALRKKREAACCRHEQNET